ncbi:MAG: putative Fe-S cluster assembly protein SufT [Betaproteobacteria bacterium]|nr:putative Fe-S cluster assembly protein SufT [Betaproteobacteria bacterium]
MHDQQVSLERDVEALLVPAGERVTLRAGELASITQALGGSYTVVVGGNMYRIESKDADALGRSPGAGTQANESAVTTREQAEAAAWAQLRTCYDPEIPVNIAELGLVYACSAAPLEQGRGWQVKVRMTLTAPGCGMGEHLVREIEQKLLAVPGVMQASVQLVWDPPWSRDMMSEAARLELGMPSAPIGSFGSESVKKRTWTLRNALKR